MIVSFCNGFHPSTESFFRFFFSLINVRWFDSINFAFFCSFLSLFPSHWLPVKKLIYEFLRLIMKIYGLLQRESLRNSNFIDFMSLMKDWREIFDR